MYTTDLKAILIPKDKLLFALLPGAVHSCTGAVLKFALATADDHC